MLLITWCTHRQYQIHQAGAGGSFPTTRGMICLPRVASPAASFRISIASVSLEIGKGRLLPHEKGLGDSKHLLRDKQSPKRKLTNLSSLVYTQLFCHPCPLLALLAFVLAVKVNTRLWRGICRNKCVGKPRWEFFKCIIARMLRLVAATCQPASCH